MRRVIVCCFATAAGFGLDEAMMVQRKAETKPNATVKVSVEEQFERGRIDESAFFDAAKCKAKTRTIKDQLLELVTGEKDRGKQMERVEKLYHTMVSNYSQHDTDRYKLYAEDDATASEHLDKLLRNEPYDPDYKLWNSFVIGVALDIQPGVDNWLPPALLGDFQMKFVMCLAKIGCKDKDNNVHHYGSVQFCGGVGFGVSMDIKLINQYRPRLVMSVGDYKFQSHGAAYNEIVANWETNKETGTGILQELGVKILGMDPAMSAAPVYSLGATPEFIATQAAEAWKGAKQAMEIAQTRALAYKEALEKKYEKEIKAAKEAAEKVKKRASDLAEKAGKSIMTTVADGQKWASKQINTLYDAAVKDMTKLAQDSYAAMEKSAEALQKQVGATAEEIQRALKAAKADAAEKYAEVAKEWEKEQEQAKASFQKISIGVLKGVKQSTVDVAKMTAASLTPDPRKVEEEAQEKALLEQLDKAEAEFAAKRKKMGTEIDAKNVDDYSRRLARLVVGHEETNDPDDPNSALYNWTQAVKEYDAEVTKMLNSEKSKYLTQDKDAYQAVLDQLLAKFDNPTNKAAFIENVWRKKEEQTKEYQDLEQAKKTLQQFQDEKKRKDDEIQKEIDDYWNRPYDEVMKDVQKDTKDAILNNKVVSAVRSAANTAANKTSNFVGPRITALKAMLTPTKKPEDETKEWSEILYQKFTGKVAEFTKDAKETMETGKRIASESKFMTWAAETAEKAADSWAAFKFTVDMFWNRILVPTVIEAKTKWKEGIEEKVVKPWAAWSKSQPVLGIWRMGQDWCMVIDDGVPS